ncbi:MAG: DUF5906 domain-containing protein [Verrucomicrobiales bacterium]|nr:DUF5906 domain-containing protein [Verrucomicrobiales bacterium]
MSHQNAKLKQDSGSPVKDSGLKAVKETSNEKTKVVPFRKPLHKQLLEKKFIHPFAKEYLCQGLLICPYVPETDKGKKLPAIIQHPELSTFSSYEEFFRWQLEGEGYEAYREKNPNISREEYLEKVEWSMKNLKGMHKFRNFGHPIPAGMIQGDIDDKNGKKQGVTADYPKLVKAVPELESIPLQTLTSSNGAHTVLFRGVPRGVNIDQNIDEYPDMEWQTGGKLIALMGNSYRDGDNKPHPENPLGEVCVQDAPEALICHLASLSGQRQGKRGESSSKAVAVNLDHLRTEAVALTEAASSFEGVEVDPHILADSLCKMVRFKGQALGDYNIWLREMVFPLKDLGEDFGFKLFHLACSMCAGYDGEEGCRKAWDASAASSDMKEGRGIGSLVRDAEKAELEYQEDVAKDLLERVEKADTIELKGDLMRDIKKADIDEEQRERLAKAYKERLGMGIDHTRTMVRSSDEPMSTGREEPDWSRPICYMPKKGYLHVDTLESWDKEALRQKFNCLVPDGTTPADIYLASYGFLKDRIIHGIDYRPDKPNDRIVYNRDGHRLVNKFRPESVTVRAEKVSKRARELFGYIYRHLVIILGCEKKAEMLMYYIAWCVQRPGIKIGWAPTIVGGQGIGKSWLELLFKALLGEANVTILQSAEIGSGWNEYATGGIVTFGHEIEVGGKNKQAAAIELKEQIDGRYGTINPKCSPKYETYLTANFVFCSNNPEVIPPEELGRRFGLWLSPWDQEFHADIDLAVAQLQEKDRRSRSDFETAVEEYASWGKPIARKYFDPLYEAVRDYPRELRALFEDYEIPDSFEKTYGQAPYSADSSYQKMKSKFNVQGYGEAKELLASGEFWFNEDRLWSKKFFDALEFDMGEPLRGYNAKRNLLAALGFKMIDAETVWIDGASRYGIYVHKKYPNTSDEAKKLFEKPIFEPFDEIDFDEI